MTYRGTVRDGVVILSADVRLPDGAEVVVSLCPNESEAEAPAGVWKALADLGRWAETLPCDLPPDLAENHDHYLHGLPKCR